MKLYIVVRQDLAPGYQIAQSLHAFREYIEHHPECERNWYKNSNTIAILGCEDEEDLISLMGLAEGRGIKLAPFYEPDLEDALTACAFEPGQKTTQFLSHLRSALKPSLPEG